MSLVEKQHIFAQNVSFLLHYIITGNIYKVTLGEVWRPPEMAQIYAKEGKGIVDSQHCKRLAIDLNLFDLDDKYIADAKPYADAGRYWKTLNKANRWGGDFKHPNVDACHFEMQG